MKPLRSLQRTSIKRLRRKRLCAGLWLLLAALVLGLIARAQGLRPDIAARIQQPVFVLSMIAALATGILATIASFQISLPDGTRWWLLLPVPTLAVWISTLGYGC